MKDTLVKPADDKSWERLTKTLYYTLGIQMKFNIERRGFKPCSFSSPPNQNLKDILSVKTRTIKWDYKNKKEMVGHISPTQSTSTPKKNKIKYWSSKIKQEQHKRKSRDMLVDAMLHKSIKLP